MSIVESQILGINSTPKISLRKGIPDEHSRVVKSISVKK